MRTIKCINQNWRFSKDNSNFEIVNIPHTWNAIDGTDGKDDYFRGITTYIKEFSLEEDLDNNELYLEFNAASRSANVFLNDVYLGSHDGGYSIFRFNITSCVKKNNILKVFVTNEPCTNVYPQQADFTFYGGIYRDVNLIIVPKSHFDLDYYGGKGIKVTPTIKDENALVKVELFTKNANGKTVQLKIGNIVQDAVVSNNEASATFIIENPHLWNGLEDPYLYQVSASLDEDLVETSFGIRSIHFDPNNGFYLNGKKYLLRGVARHQDKEGKGVAITREDMEEDLQIILDMGVTAVRLAHYQHDQYFYDLCDKVGLIAWAEIPYISEHLIDGRENTLHQMKELVIQNYNHPSIICWGLSNEISISNDENVARYNNHVALNELCHALDKTRPTAMAHIGAFSYDTNKLFNIPDIHGTNIYYGWYEKNVKDTEEYFDVRHKNHPNACLSITEYGADCNPKYCGLDKERGDYSENYQCYYHEEMLRIIEERPYFWASFVWNMFDFGADGRNEGGNPGKNQKGLVTFDRKYKKDAYFMYQSHWSKKPMLHICNKHYVHRIETKSNIIVYSNQPSVSFYIDNVLKETKQGMYKYVFNFTLEKDCELKVVANDLVDKLFVEKVTEKDPSYQLDDKSVINWLGFIDKERDGYFTLQSRVSEILANEEASNYTFESLKDYGVTRAYLTSDNPRAPGTTLELIPIKFVLRMCKGLTPEGFNNFAEGLMKIKK